MSKLIDITTYTLPHLNYTDEQQILHTCLICKRPFKGADFRTWCKECLNKPRGLQIEIEVKPKM